MKSVVEYDGSCFAGFQLQSDLPSVQGALESAIAAVTGNAVRVTAAGRTDAGAHAAGQVISFVTDTRLGDHDLLNAVNANLPGDVALQSLDTVQESFDPRRDAVRREYHYIVLNRSTPSPLWRGRAHHVRTPLDEHRMQEAAQTFVGVHDFSSFGNPSTEGGIPIREIYSFQVGRDDELITFAVMGSGFMQHMIRTLVGTLLGVGEGRFSADQVQGILAARDRSRSAAPAPAHGLYLMNVKYEPLTYIPTTTRVGQEIHA